MNDQITAVNKFGQKYGTLFLSVGVFLLALLPRAIYSVSPNLNWYLRSIRFWDAITSQNWIGTFQQYHPGVTTMWLAGAGIRIFGWFRGFSSEELIAVEDLPTGVAHQAMNAGVISLAIGISLGIVLIYLLLAKLINNRIALISAILIAIDPFHIAQSKSLHLDAILSILMLIALLLLLYYKQQKVTWILIMAGVFTGFSLLTKSPTAILIPIGALIIASSNKLILPKENSQEQWKTRFRWFVTVFRTLMIWGIAIAVTFIVFWPAMWVTPIEMVVRIIQAVFIHTISAHPNPVYFDGGISLEDPGAIYYGLVLLLRTSTITFLLFLIGVGKLLLDFTRKSIAKNSAILWILLFGVLFLIQMLASAKKGDRYVLPFFPVVDIFAAFGLVCFGGFVSRRFKNGNRKLLASLSIGVILVIQAGIVFSLHPYYGNGYNRLFGGIQRADEVLGIQTLAEGIDLAGQYLNTIPDSSEARVAIYYFGSDMLNQHFGGIVEGGNDDFVPDSDYRVYYANQIVRNLGGEVWNDAWEADKLREPERIIELNEIPFVWIYKTPIE